MKMSREKNKRDPGDRRNEIMRLYYIIGAPPNHHLHSFRPRLLPPVPQQQHEHAPLRGGEGEDRKGIILGGDSGVGERENGWFHKKKPTVHSHTP